LTRWHVQHSADVATWQILEVEQETPLEITSHHGTIALPDLVARIPGHGYTVLDHKSVYNFMSDQIYEIGTQLPKYAAALRQKYDIRSVGYNEVRWRPIASSNPDDFSRLHIIELKDVRQIRTLSEHVVISEQIGHMRDSRPAKWDALAYRTANAQVCNTCPFKDICASDMRGEDRELMMGAMYQPKTHRNERAAKEITSAV
jgi:predicted RecB family nuclease